MAALEVIALDTVTPQLRAPGAGDTYTFPRAVAMTGALTYGGVTLNNAVTGTGDMVLSVSPTFTTPVLGTPSSVTLTNATGLPLSTGVTGTLPAANGGTGQSSYAQGDLLYASASTTLSKLAIGSAGQVLQAGATDPEWGGLSGNNTTIQLAFSSTPGAVPSAVSLSAGELVVNTADGKLYFKDSVGAVGVLAQADQIAPLTTKGDLVVNDGTSNVRLPVGTDGYVLTADSASTEGVKWAAAGGGGSSTLTIQNKTAAYTVVAGDLGTIINCTSGTFTVSLDPASTLGAGFNCWVWNTSSTSTDAITIDPNGSETIDGVSTLILRRGEGMQIVCDGTNWQTGDKKTMRGYADNIITTQDRPIASGDRSISIGGSSVASATSSVAFGNAANASSTNAVALGASSTSSGNSSISIGASTTASAASSTAIGRNSSNQGSQAVTGSGAMALGGSRASGADSFAAAIQDNTSSYGAKATGAIAIGNRNQSTATSAVSVGDYNIASGSLSQCFGDYCEATTTLSFAYGSQAKSALYGKWAYASASFVAAGEAQLGTMVLRRATTNSTPTALTSNNSAQGATNQVILPNNSAYAFTGVVVARQQAAGGTASAAWKIEGLIRREGSAGTTTLVASTVAAIDNTPGWTLALSADTTNGGLAITATGAAATNIRWVATVQTSEVTY